MSEICPDCGGELRLIEPQTVGAQAESGTQFAECQAPDCGQRFERPAPNVPWRPFA